MEQMDLAINEEPTRAHPFFLDELDHTCVGLTLAKLCGRPEFDELRNVYRSSLEGWDEMFLEQYDKLSETLSNLRS